MNEERVSEMEYLEYPEKGVVVAKLYNCAFIPISRIYDQLRFWVSNEDLLKYCIADTYVGVAKCSPDDTFDLETGRKIALTKAKRARGKAVNNAIKKFISDMTADLKRLEEYGIHKIPDPSEIYNK